MKNRTQVFLNIIGNVFLLFSQWLISVFIARFYDFANAGVFSLAMTYGNLVSIIASFSSRSYMLSDSVNVFSYNQYISFRIFSSVLSFLLCLLLLFIFQYDINTSTSILFYSLYSVSTMISDILYAIYQKQNHLEYSFYSMALKGIFCICSFFISSFCFRRLQVALFFMSFSSFFTFVFVDIPLYSSTKKNRESFCLDFSKISILVKECFPIMMSTLLPSVVVSVPRLVVQKYLGDELLGIYGSIFSPTVLINTIVPALVFSIIPKLSVMWLEHDVRSFFQCVLKIITFTLIFGLILSFGAWLCGKFFLGLLYGKEILSYFDLFYYAIATTVLSATASTCTVLLTIIRKTKVSFVCTFVTLVIVVAFSNLFVSSWGLWGASMCLICAYFVEVLLKLVILCREGKNACKKKV